MDITKLEQYQLNWESRSSVRTRPRKIIDFNIPGDFFSRDKQALFSLSEISSLNENKSKEILILSLQKYLNDIVQLESKWIYAACNSIIYKKLPINFLDFHQLNACTVIIDEYYHIYIAQDLLLQLRSRYPHLPDLKDTFSDSYHAMVTIKGKLDDGLHDLFEILAVCIFETTLVRELVTYFDGEAIHPSIKHYMNDHMNDEARHFGFFYDLLCYVWGSMSDENKKIIGANLGEFVSIYLNIDGEIRHNKSVLAWVLNDQNKADELVGKLYDGFIISSDIPIVKNVLNVLTKAGILELPYVQQSFKEKGLINY
ncbi:MAG: diiron oxygenase [Legionellaceae bacterium]|nr:diiron oxygenase [Legionellaceae bacterium]